MMKHTVGFPFDTEDDDAIRQALDIAAEDLRAAGVEVPPLVAAVVRDEEHAANGEFVVVVRDGGR